MKLPVRMNSEHDTRIVDLLGWQVATCATPTERNDIVRAINKHPGLVHVVRQVLFSLPAKRDWLDPDIERMAKDLLKDEPFAETLSVTGAQER